MSPTVVAKLMLPILDHLYAAVLSTAVPVWVKGCILVAKMWTYAGSAVSSIFLIVTSSTGFRVGDNYSSHIP